MNYSKLQSRTISLFTDKILLTGAAAALLSVHVVITQLAVYWTHPHHSDPSRAPLIALAGLSLSTLLVFELHKTIRYVIADGVKLADGLAELQKGFMFCAALSAVAVGCNLAGLILQLAPEYLWLAVAGALGLVVIVPRSENDKYQPHILRGTTIQTIEHVQTRIARETPPHVPCECWAGLRYPTEYARTHYLTVGGTESGKTVLARVHMSSTLPRIVPGSDWRALIFDAKGDAASIVAGIAPPCPVYIMKPTDYRSVAWDMAADIDSPATAHQVTNILVKLDNADQNGFFVRASQGLLSGVMEAFIITRPGQWTLSEVLRTLSRRETIEAVLDSTPQTRHKADQYIRDKDPKTIANVLYTLYAYLSWLEPMAAANDHATRKISLKQWLTEESIIILGHDEMHKSSMQAMNLAMLECLHQLVLSQTESHTRRTLLYIDELCALGKWESLPLFLDMSRSKGGCAFLSFQLIEHLRAIYGDHLADAIAGLPGNKAILHCRSITTSQWASDVIGKCDMQRFSYSETTGKDKSVTLTEVRDLNYSVVLPSEIMGLPRPNRERFFGYFVSPAFGVFHGPVYFQNHLAPKARVPDFVPRPVSHQYLEDTDAPKATQTSRVQLEEITWVTGAEQDPAPLDDATDPLFDWEDPADDVDAQNDDQD